MDKVIDDEFDPFDYEQAEKAKKKYDFFDLTRCPVCHGVLKDDAPLACRCGWKGEKKK